MTVDRKKFKATPMNAIKKQEEEFEKVAPKPQQQNKSFAGWLTVTKGTNKFRIMPAHKDSTTFIYPRTTSWIPKEVEVEDGKGGKKTEIKRGPIFNARVHSSAGGKDIIEEYVRIATEQLTEQIKDEAKLAKELSKLTYWETGLLPKSDWICYAQKYENGKKEMGLLALSYSLKEQLNTLSAVEDSEQPIATDPFTDPDDGKAIIITKNVEVTKTKGGKTQERTKYTVAIEFRGDYALTDEELIELDGFASLQELYVNSYTKKDYEVALKGLQIFDEENDFYVFNNPDFVDVMNELADLYPEKKSNDAESEVEEKEVDLDSMDRAQIKAFVKEKGLHVPFRAGLTEEEMRDMVREVLNENEEISSAEEQLEEKTGSIVDGPATDIDDMLDKKPGASVKKEKAGGLLGDVKAKLGKGK